jgi:hypothetical protein
MHSTPTGSSFPLQALDQVTLTGSLGQASCTAAIAGHRCPQSQLHPITIWVVVLGHNGSFFLFHLAVSPSDNGQQVMQDLRRFLATDVYSHSGIISRNLLHRLFWTNSIKLATLAPVSTGRRGMGSHPATRNRSANKSYQFSQVDLEVSICPREVLVHDRAASEYLNGGFHHPAALSDQGAFVGYFPSLSPAARSRQAILIERKLNKMGVVWLVAITLVLCLVVGVIVGVVSHDFSKGAACGAVLLGLVAAAEGLVFWALS